MMRQMGGLGGGMGGGGLQTKPNFDASDNDEMPDNFDSDDDEMPDLE